MRSKHTFRIYVSNLFSVLIQTLFKKPLKQYNNSILVVNTEKLGDIILSLDFLSAIRAKNEYQSYFIVLDKRYGSILSPKSGFKVIPLSKYVYKYNIFYKLSFIKSIRQRSFRTIINVSPERGMMNEEITLTSGAIEKIALKGSSLFLSYKNLKRNNNLYSFIFKSQEVNEYRRLAYYTIIRHAKNDMLKSCSIIPQLKNIKNYIVVAPMASEMDRTWGINKYKELICQLNETIILLGSGREVNVLKKIAGNSKDIINLAGKTSLREAADIIKGAQLFIGNDSGHTHIAYYYNIPMVAIIGGGKYNIFFPYRDRENAKFLTQKLDCYGCHWFCKYSEMECLNVSIEKVYNEVMSLARINNLTSSHKEL